MTSNAALRKDIKETKVKQEYGMIKKTSIDWLIQKDSVRRADDFGNRANIRLSNMEAAGPGFDDAILVEDSRDKRGETDGY